MSGANVTKEISRKSQGRSKKIKERLARGRRRGRKSRVGVNGKAEVQLGAQEVSGT